MRVPPIDVAANNNVPHLIRDQLRYNPATLQQQLADHITGVAGLNAEQRPIFDAVMDAVQRSLQGGLPSGRTAFMVYSPGGCGKTHVFNLLLAAVRAEQHPQSGRPCIALAVASSGIASLLMEGGATAHSRFKIPINITFESLCNIASNSELADLIRVCSLILWDEAPMMHRHCFEALDRTLQDITQCRLPFGGKVVVLGGDFRQVCVEWFARFETPP
jgi:ATP-dependent DNA helicase PIF1